MKIKQILLALVGSTTLMAQTNVKTTQSCTGKVFSTGVNCFGTGGQIDTQRQGCLTYNKDLNAMLWVHRASPVWGFTGFTSGAVQADWLNLATNKWDSTIIFTNPAADSGARFPSGVFYNPAGNTSLSNAYAVGVGPTAGTSPFNGTFVAKRQLTGNYNTVTSAQTNNVIYPLGAQPFGRINGNNGTVFLNTDLQQVGNKLFVGGGLVDNLQIIVSDNSNHNYGGTIAHATNFVWSIDTIVPDFYKGTSGYISDGEPVRLAFAPDGQTGYAFFIGRLATNFNNGADSTLSPIVYKTTNGGATWSSSPILPGYDWAAQHPEVLRTAGKPQGAPNARQFELAAKHGTDLVVDSTGTLHIIGTVQQPFWGTPATIDSLIFSYLFPWDYAKYHPVIWDFMTDGTQWKTLLVDSIMTGDLGFISQVSTAVNFDSTGNFNPFNSSGIQLPYGSRVQISRSVSGGKIFYSWTDSDSSQTHQPYNVSPNIHIKSYDISNQKVTATMNATAGINKCYFHFLSEVSYFDNTQQAWVMPMVYTTDRNNINPPYNTTGPVNYNYINCATINAAQYTNPANVNQVTGIKQMANNIGMNLYPNPAQNNFTVEVSNYDKQTLSMYDISGKQVLQQNVNGITSIDVSTLQSGMYFIQLKNIAGISTQKLMVQH